MSSNLLTFGLLFVDVDNDGWPDLLAANGHVDLTVHNFLVLVSYEEPPVLFLNRTAQEGGVNKPQFRDVAAQVGLDTPLVGRGLCVADYDLDRDLDVLITTSAGQPLLMRNDGGNSNNSIRLVLRGKAPNEDGIGAHIKAVIQIVFRALGLYPFVNKVKHDFRRKKFGFTQLGMVEEILTGCSFDAGSAPLAANSHLPTHRYESDWETPRLWMPTSNVSLT